MPHPHLQPNPPDPTDRFRLETTADGSQTFYSNEFKQLFHSHFGAHQEAEAKFVQVTRLAERATERSHLTLIDICYGLGYNTAAALTAIWQANPQCRVVWYGLEADRDVPHAAIAANLLQAWPPDVRQLLTDLAQAETLDRDTIQAQLLIGDARQTITQLRAAHLQADAIFLDPFAPPDCPQLWTVEFLHNVAHCLAQDGYLATYSCAAAVRSALIAAGLHIGSTPPIGRNTHGTAARWIADDLTPLDRRAREHLHTRAAIPYRDPNGTDRAEILHTRRREEQLRSPLEATTRWKKRWRQPLSLPATEPDASSD
jgi:tRNA U34 5-methylaminomethyl-2-thiouridine-forming methyltransferase MnmC